MKLKTIGLISILALGLMVASIPVEAQESKKVYRIGYLVPRTALKPRDKAFLQGLRDLGYVAGKNLIVESRLGTRKQLPKLAAELVDLNVDVIVAPGTPPAKAAKTATKTIPIVFAVIADPVGAGFVNSLARPGGNITGLTPSSAELSGKRLELLKEIIPSVTRVAVLSTPDYPLPLKTEALKEMEAAARALGVRLQLVEVRGRNDFGRAFSAVSRGRAEALTVLPVPMFRAEQKRIINFAAKNRLPTVFHWKPYVEAGGLMSYGPDGVAMYRRAASYVDKLLKGAKPADLPVERARDFELVINLKTAKQLGITIPPSIRYRADKVIK